MTGNAGAVAAWLGGIAHDLPRTVDLAVAAALDELIRALEPVTPVVSGRMRAGYTAQRDGDGTWLLLDTAASPGGYPYPARVFDDPTWSRQYEPLNRALDAGAAALADDLDVAVARLAARPL